MPNVFVPASKFKVILKLIKRKKSSLTSQNRSLLSNCIYNVTILGEKVS